MSDQPPQWGTGNTGDQGGYGAADGGQGGFGGPPSYGGGGGFGAQPPSATGVIVAAVISIFCCTPLGVASLVLAIMGNGKASSGDIAGAESNLSLAKKLAIASIVLGIIGTILYVILIVAVGVGGDAATSGSDF